MPPPALGYFVRGSCRARRACQTLLVRYVVARCSRYRNIRKILLDQSTILGRSKNLSNHTFRCFRCFEWWSDDTSRGVGDYLSSPLGELNCDQNGVTCPSIRAQIFNPQHPLERSSQRSGSLLPASSPRPSETHSDHKLLSSSEIVTVSLLHSTLRHTKRPCSLKKIGPWSGNSSVLLFSH